jgi:hypothetical protein
VRAIPPEVRFHFENSEERTVKITPRFAPRNGYLVTDFTVTPDSISITGPASRVAHVDTVLTDPVDVPAQAGAFDMQVNAFVDDPFVRFSRESRVSVAITVKKE